MRRVAMLMLLTMVVTSLVGCGCCRRLRDRVGRGAYCGPTAAPAQQYVAAPQCAAPAPSVVYDAGCGYDPGCAYGAAYGSSSGFQSYPMDSGTYDSGWSGGAPATGGVMEPTPVYPGPAGS
ncbi:hypothetical protein Pla175_33650 [Pirellulimonas nuda]|uniref:Lipoprotein n=1 Tax=Pirellulimonas nuda TaxID=2528009 RepID=A0A518DER5_9BACT|nr:hypothetical protein Pla175_33650 [Pirellulimonas nuda]